MPNDTELKIALARMFPDEIGIINFPNRVKLIWTYNQGSARVWGEEVKDTELLEICHMVERKYLTENTDKAARYINILEVIIGSEMTLDSSKFYYNSPTWQQRTQALMKVLNAT